MLIIKPDAFERRLVGSILDEIENKSKVLRVYSGQMTAENCAVHYRDHVGKPFYGRLVEHMISGISLFVDAGPDWELQRAQSTEIRQYYGTEGPRNLIHASDSQEAHERETAYWFHNYGG